MDISIVSDLLDRMPASRSNYEFKNFKIDQYGSFPRQLRAALIEKEQLTDAKAEIDAEIGLIQLNISQLPTDDSKEFLVLKSSAQLNQLMRQSKDIAAQIAQVDSWLDQLDMEECNTAVDNFEDREGDYWTEKLGKDAAVELLAINHVKNSTMTLLSQLPFSDYKKAVIITAQLATFLKETTEQAEAVLYPQTNLPNGKSTPVGSEK